MPWGRRKHEKLHRAPRILVPNNEKAVFTVADDKFVGVIQRLSLTGGSAVFPKAVPDGTIGEMMLNTVYGNVMADIQFLHTGADGVPEAQAFSFLEMDDTSAKRFRAAAEKMESAGFSDAEMPEPSLTDKALESVRGMGARIASRLQPRKK